MDGNTFGHYIGFGSYSLSPKVSVRPVLFSKACASAFVVSRVLWPLIDVTRSPSLIPFCAALLPELTCKEEWNALNRAYRYCPVIIYATFDTKDVLKRNDIYVLHTPFSDTP